ncbi:hypothetical protein Tco_1314947 [Tanacetum coccineum]
MSSPRHYGEKSHKSIIDPWRHTHLLPYSPPLSPNNSLPTSSPTSPIFDTTPLPPSLDLPNPTSSSLLPQTSIPIHSENRLHEHLHLSNLLDINIQHAIELTNHSPPSSPFTHPPFLDQGLLRKTLHSQLVDKQLNSFSAKGFSEDVCQLILRIDKVKLYYSVLNLLFYEVESDVNMF